jgi:hypothetical protein
MTTAARAAALHARAAEVSRPIELETAMVPTTTTRCRWC